MTITIENAAQAIVALDRKAMALGQEVGGVAENLRRLPKLAYELSTDDLASASRRAGEIHSKEADALEREGAKRRNEGDNQNGKTN